jgi:hypothetical protein
MEANLDVACDVSPFDVDRHSSNVGSGTYLDSFYQNVRGLRANLLTFLTTRVLLIFKSHV